MRSGRDLIDDHPAFSRDKKLNARHAHHAQPIQDGCGHSSGSRQNIVWQARRSRGNIQNVMAVHIASRFKNGCLARVPPGCHDRNLSFKIDPCFQHKFVWSESFPGRRDVGWRINPPLPLPVVAEGSGFEHSRQSQCGNRGVQVINRTHGAVRRAVEAVLDEKCFFPAAILCGEKHVRCGTYGHDCRHRLRSLNRHVLKLERHDVEHSGDLRELFGIIGGPSMHAIAMPRCRTVGLVGNGLNAIAHSLPCHRKHRTELAAPHHAQCRTRPKHISRSRGGRSKRVVSHAGMSDLHH